MQFNLSTFLEEVRTLGKLKYLTYENGEEAVRILNSITLTSDEGITNIDDPAALTIYDHYAERGSDRMFGFMVGKIKKGLVGKVKFNLNAMLLKDGSLVVYNPYNDILALSVSGSRKMTFTGTNHELYCADLQDIWRNHEMRGKGPKLHGGESTSYSWNIPSNAVVVYDLLFTHLLNQPQRVDSIIYEGVILV